MNSIEEMFREFEKGRERHVVYLDADLKAAFQAGARAQHDMDLAIFGHAVRTMPTSIDKDTVNYIRAKIRGSDGE